MTKQSLTQYESSVQMPETSSDIELIGKIRRVSSLSKTAIVLLQKKFDEINGLPFPQRRSVEGKTRRVRKRIVSSSRNMVVSSNMNLFEQDGNGFQIVVDSQSLQNGFWNKEG